MSASQEKRPFTSEILKKRRAAQEGGTPSGRLADGAATVSNAEILAAINDLKALIQRVAPPEPTPVPAAPPVAPTAAPAVDPAAADRAKELAALRAELQMMSRSIQETKADIAAFWAKDPEDDHIQAITHELDAVVAATENATDVILESAERIDQLSHVIRASAGDKTDIHHAAEEISELVVRVFESCNFQDLTGQRITKVVNTLKFIEGHINHMIEVWGAEDIAAVTPAARRKGDQREDAHLLNGPQLGNRGISQDEIDKLFG